jgi:D-3-phosphoglycerate dehydrogenase
MEVYGCDPYISIDAAWHLDHHIIRVNNRDEIYENCDIISLHTPLLESTKGMINKEALSKMKDGVIILNFARDQLVDDEAMAWALQTGKVRRYVTDFPNDKTAGMPGVIAIPHLGASTEESEDNCAMMAIRQMMNYLENGNIVNSVNFPACDMGPLTKPCRVLVLHKNVPNTITKFTAAIARDNVNISDMLNRSKGEYACTMLDLDGKIDEQVIAELKSLDETIRVRVFQ